MDILGSSIIRSHKELGTVFGLCLEAVAQARIELDCSSPKGNVVENFVNVHLADTLAGGFSPEQSQRRLHWNQSMCQDALLRYQSSCARLRTALELGKDCLFILSQETWPEHGRSIYSSSETEAQLTSIGSLCFQTAVAHSSDRKQENVSAYDRLAEYFSAYSRIIGHAGMILGFHRLDRKLLMPAVPVLTMNDFLEVLAAYGKQPDRAHWEALRNATECYKILNEDFHFELPPQPLE